MSTQNKQNLCRNYLQKTYAAKGKLKHLTPDAQTSGRNEYLLKHIKSKAPWKLRNLKPSSLPRIQHQFCGTPHDLDISSEGT